MHLFKHIFMVIYPQSQLQFTNFYKKNPMFSCTYVYVFGFLYTRM